jgi:hypothetical protein
MTRIKRINADFLCIICVLLVSYPNSLRAQEIVPPLDIPLFLSGNFGELRNDHFHSGIDFKTQGTTGLPVKSVKEGYISRISVSPSGYGRVVYISHPDGITSVYAHLDKFIPRIEETVRDSQYVQKSFPVNLFFSPEDFPLKQAEIFAYSGNSGSSGGPHLHFELRDTQSERPFDPVSYFKNKIKDNVPPEIRGIMIFPKEGKGIVNGSSINQEIPITNSPKNSNSKSQSVRAWGEIGVGINAYDKMDGTSNIYGVKEIILKLDGEAIFHSVIDGFLLEDTRYLNSFIDWKTWKESHSFYMKSFIDQGNYFDIYHAGFNGIISITEERDYRFEYILTDAFGNAKHFVFSIIGEKADIPAKIENGILFSYNRNNYFREKGIELSIPYGNLYTNVNLNIQLGEIGSPYAPLYSLGVKAPLHTYCSLTLDIPNDTYPDKSKYGVVAVNGKDLTWLGGEYENHRIKTRIRELGDFSVTVDTVSPKILPLKTKSKDRIIFRISDDLSGINSYHATLDGKFVLFEYDPKKRTLICVFDPKRMKYGQQTLRLEVTDKAGNLSVMEKSLNFPTGE